MAADYSRIHRLLKILTLVQSEPGWTPRRLALECGHTERTIFRDLKMLQAAGIPIYHDPDAGGYAVRRDFFMQPVELTLDESLALMTLAKYVGGAEQIPFTRAAAKALTKIRGQLPHKIREHLDGLDGHLSVRMPHVSSHDGCGDVYDRVGAAIATRRALRCRYESAGGRSAATAGQTFVFKPYTLFFGQRAWYCVGHHGGRGGVRTLKLSRFTLVEPTDQPYLIPDDFSLDKHLGNAWRMIRGDKTYDVVLHFDPAFADGIAETNWHRTQKVDYQADGSILFRCRVDGLDEVTWWVLSMGHHCVVRKPRELAERVKDLARRILLAYGETPVSVAPLVAAGTGGWQDPAVNTSDVNVRPN